MATATDDAGHGTLKYKGMDDVPADDSQESHAPVKDENGVYRDAEGRPQLHYPDMGGQKEEPADPATESLKRFGQDKINEISSLIQTFRDDETGLCDLSMLDRHGFGDNPEVVGAFADTLVRLKEYKQLYDGCNPLTDSDLRHRYKREIQDLLVRAMEESKARYVKKHGSLSSM